MFSVTVVITLKDQLVPLSTSASCHVCAASHYERRACRLVPVQDITTGVTYLWLVGKGRMVVMILIIVPIPPFPTNQR